MGSFFSALLIALPNLIPAFIGLILCAIFWQRARKASVLVVIACVLLLLQALVQVLNMTWLTHLVTTRRLSVSTYSAVSSLVFWVLNLGTLGCLLGAAFSGRDPRAKMPADSLAPRPSPAPPGDVRPHRGATVLVLSLVGLFILPPLGIVSCIIGVSNLRAMQRGTMDNSGYGMTLAGVIIGALDILWMLVGIALGMTFAYHLAHMNWAPH